MNISLDILLKLLLAGGSLFIGASLTALRATKKKIWLHRLFYILPVLVLAGVACILFFPWAEISKPENGVVVIIPISIISSILLIYLTHKSPVAKEHYTTEELNPVVNAFSKSADKDNIKLWAGNLDFFGKTLADIDRHDQYKCLKEESFREIQIICTEPSSYNDKLRYGKIITDLPAKLKYYEPSSADLKVRGRIKTLNNVIMLLIYRKVDSGIYEAIPLDTAETDGAHYSHLWSLIWGLSQKPTEEELAEYKEIYQRINH